MYCCASAAVHSWREVGLLMAKMTGRSLRAPISARISGVKSLPVPVKPISTEGFTCAARAQGCEGSQGMRV